MDLYQKNLICDQFYVGAILGWTIGGHVGLHMLKRLGIKEEKSVSKCAYQMFCLKNTGFFPVDLALKYVYTIIGGGWCNCKKHESMSRIFSLHFAYSNSIAWFWSID